MGVIRVRRKVTKWGHAFGIRLTKAEMKELGLHANDVADVEVSAKPPKADWSHITTLDLGPDASERHDEIFGQGLLDDEERQNARR